MRELGNSVQQTADGGYVIGGWTNSFGAGGADVYLIKTDGNGNILWTKTYGGSTTDEGLSVQQTADGGYIISGWTQSFGPSFDIYLIRTDGNGNTIWSKTYGGSGIEFSWCVKQTADSGYIITGYTDSFGDGLTDAYLIKTDATGDTLWTKTFGGRNYDEGHSVQQTSDGGYIVTGYTRSSGDTNGDVWLIKTDAGGDTLWTKTFGGSNGDFGYWVQQTTDGGYIITGTTTSGSSNVDVWLIRTDGNGNILWTKTYGGSATDEGFSVQQTSDGGYIITGYTSSFGAGLNDVYLIKTDATGDTLWTKTFGGINYDVGNSVQQTDDDGYILTGQTWSFGAGDGDVWLIKIAEGLQIIKPTEGDHWIAGETDTIKWSGGFDVDSIEIWYSTDYENGSGTFSLLVDNYPSSASEYIWDIPNTILSKKCVISIKDVHDPGNFADSRVFKIKGYELSRLNANGDYDRYLPFTDGWRFANAVNFMWPAGWWSNFDYSLSVDPYTNSPYPDFFLGPPVLAQSENFPDWPLFVKTFGTNSCYFELVPGVLEYRPSAVTKWTAIKGSWGGSCFGFAISSYLVYDYLTEFQTRYPELSGFNDLYNVAITDTARKVINEIFNYQFGRIFQQHRSLNHFKSPSQTLEEIKEMLLSEEKIERGLLLITTSGAHIVNPYFAEIDSGSTDWLVHVYDSNFPGSATERVLIDPNFDFWSFSSKNWSGFVGLFLTDPIDNYLMEPLQKRSNRINSQLMEGTGKLEIYNTSEISISIKDPLEKIIGFSDSTLINNITDAFPIFPITGGYHPPIGYNVPLANYSVTTNNYKDSTFQIFIFNDSTIYSYTRTDASPAQTDKIYYSDGISLVNPDESRIINFETILIDEDNEKVFSIKNSNTSSGDSLNFNISDKRDLNFKNFGAQKNYNLELYSVSSLGKSIFEHSQVNLPSNSVHYIVPVWEDLQNQSVKILIDLGINGTIDDSIFVENQVTGIKRQGHKGLPKEYKLAQNYPNPFNPTTKIDYWLPVNSKVTLKIFDISGKAIKTLLNRQQDAGEHSLTFNGSNLASGIYFYTIQAGDFIQTKKMIILK